MKLISWLPAVAVMSAVSGCNTIEVYDPSGTGLKGVPFYVKVPVLTQETKLMKSELLVRITVTQGPEAARPMVVPFPAAGPLVVPSTDLADVETALDEFLRNAPGKTFPAARALAGTAIESIRKKIAKPAEEMVVSNTWSLTMTPGPAPYYINNRQPLIGTATGTYELSADGTLTKASATVTDDTVKTLLSLFPISAKISQRWGLPGAEAAALTPELPVQLEVSVSERKTLYTLRRVSALNGESTIGAYAQPKEAPSPLSLADGLAGAKGVQLVSREIVGADNPKSGGDPKGYQIEGIITPPATDAPKAK